MIKQEVTNTMLRKISFIVFAVALAAATVYAQTQSPDLKSLEKEAKNIDATTAKMTNPDKPFEVLSNQLGIKADVLKSEKQSTNFGFGQLFIANALAKASGKTFEDIAAQFQSGQGWGAIAKANNLKLGPIVSDMKRADKSLQQEHRSEMAAQRGQSAQPHGSAARTTVPKGPKK